MFKIKERGSNVRTEVIGGITTFFAMAYIIFVNPLYLSMTGMDKVAVMVATCVSAGIGTLLTAFIANVPFAQAPGMGLNAFFTFTVCFGMGYTWQQALGVVLVSGILFLIITLTPLRKGIISAIPAPLKSAIGAGIGLFIAFIGLINAGIVTAFGAEPPFSAFTTLGNIASPGAILAIIGIIITAILLAYKVKGALFFGIVATTLISFIPWFGNAGFTALVTGQETFSLASIGNISQTFFAFDFNGMLALGIVPLITACLSFLIVDMFDTVGTLIGTADNAGMLDKDGNFPGGDKALVADAIATVTGACLGTSTVTTYIESSTGIEEGAKTGLASLVTGGLLALCVLIAPLVGIIPGSATAPALIIVGVFMMKSVLKIDWSDIEISIPAFLTVAMMPFSYSIANGIGFGFISYVIIKVARGKFKEVPVMMYVLAALFVVMYIMQNIG